MDRPPIHDPSTFHEPAARYAHSAVPVGGRVFLWGGADSSWNGISASTVHVFDDLGIWTPHTTSGTPPEGVCSAASTVLDNKIFSLGGTAGFSWGDPCYNTLHCLDLSSFTWNEMIPINPQQAPVKKRGCKMVSHGKDELALFAGMTEDNKHTNDLQVYNLKQGEESLHVFA